MEIDFKKLRIDTARPIEAPLDFATLCMLLAQYQAATPTARLARGEPPRNEGSDRHNPAIDVLLSAPGQAAPATDAHGSFHQAAAALFNERS